MILIELLGFGKSRGFYKEMEKRLVPFLKKVILENHNNYIIIASGWRGEAEWLKDFLGKRSIPFSKIYIETEACMTFENISFVFNKLFIEKEGWPNFNQISEIIFVGEMGSQNEVLWLAPRIYSRITRRKKAPKIRFFPLKLMSFDDRRKKEKKIILNKMTFYFPIFYKLMRFLRKNDIV